MDLAVGTRGDDDGGSDRGAVWILFMREDGMVDSHQKISQTSGGFLGTLSNTDRFGYTVDGIGDLNGDGITELAVGAVEDDDGGSRMHQRASSLLSSQARNPLGSSHTGSSRGVRTSISFI